MLRRVIEAEGRSFAVKIRPKEVEKELVHRIARQYAVSLPGYWHPRAIFGEGDVCRYQDGDVIRLFPATEASLRTVTEPRTERRGETRGTTSEDSEIEAGLDW
jgi:hypothetical protein